MKKITIGHIYPEEMNIYGDFGNTMALQRRLEWRGIDSVVVRLGREMSSLGLESIDVLVGGGGQDSGQLAVETDLKRHKKEIAHAVEDGMPMLMICGMYQLFGNEFVTYEGKKLEGIGVFDMNTSGLSKRMIGNVVINTSIGEIVGFENHSGSTQLQPAQPSFGSVIQGSGNNGQDDTEGAHTRNAIGTYLHGPILPKNPNLTDYLLEKALLRRYGGGISLEKLNDEEELRAYKVARSLAY